MKTIFNHVEVPFSDGTTPIHTLQSKTVWLNLPKLCFRKDAEQWTVNMEYLSLGVQNLDSFMIQCICNENTFYMFYNSIYDHLQNFTLIVLLAKLLTLTLFHKFLLDWKKIVISSQLTCQNKLNTHWVNTTKD